MISPRSMWIASPLQAVSCNETAPTIATVAIESPQAHLISITTNSQMLAQVDVNMDFLRL